MAFKRLTGEPDIRELLVDSSTIITIGQLVSTDESAGDLINGATNVANAGVALEASESSSTTAIRYDKLTPGSIWRADVVSGTPVITLKGKFCDITKDGAAVETTTNSDARIRDWNGTADTMDIEFTTTESLGPDTA